MNKHLVIPVIVLSALLILLFASQSRAEESFQITTSDHSRGSASSLFQPPDSRVLPISASYETERYILVGTVSYQQQNGVRGMPYVNAKITQSSATDLGSSLADYVARDADLALTYKVPQALPGGWSLEATGTLQFQNGIVVANRSAVLRNYAMDLEVSRPFGRFTAEVGVGYKLNDRSVNFDKRNAAYAYVGGAYQINLQSSIKVYLDARQASRVGEPVEAEVSAYFNQKLPWKKMSLQSYAFKGLNENNRAIETGILIQRAF